MAPNTFSGQGSLSGVGSLQTEILYNIGDTGPGGGKIFYDAGSTLSWGRYMEAAVSTTSPTWVDAGRTAGPLSSFGSSSTAIGTGLANTNLMVAQDATANRAHTICRSFTGGGKTDWFLPSKDELNQLYIRRATIGDLVSTYYWSSSEHVNPQQLLIQYFVNGSQFENYKNNTAHARAIRYV
jgi:hypothetical protein